MTPLSEQLRDEALLRARAWIEDWDRAHPGGNRAYALFTEDIGAIARVPDPSVLPWVATTATPGPAWICGVDDRFALPGHLRSHGQPIPSVLRLVVATRNAPPSASCHQLDATDCTLGSQ